MYLGALIGIVVVGLVVWAIVSINRLKNKKNQTPKPGDGGGAVDPTKPKTTDDDAKE